MARGKGKGPKVKRSRVKVDGYTKMIEYMENRENFQILHGNKRPKIGGKIITKTSAFRAMAVTLPGLGWHEVSELNGEAMKKKWDRYLEKYKKVKMFLSDTGEGLPKADIKVGLTLEDKVELRCPHFLRMDVVFGGRSNMDVPVEGCIRVSNKFDADSGSEESNDNGAGESDNEEGSQHDGSARELPDGECQSSVDPALTQPPITVPKGEVGDSSIDVDPLITQPSVKITEDMPQKKKKKVLLEDKPTPRMTLLAMYSKTLDNTSAYQQRLVKMKERLKMLELAEQRESQRKAERAINKRAKTCKIHELELAKLQKKMEVITDVAKARKSPEEVTQWINLLNF